MSRLYDAKVDEERWKVVKIDNGEDNYDSYKLVDKKNEEINLEKKDYLNSKQYSKALKQIIDAAPENKVFTVGLFGGWGTGKSSIIKTTEELYKNDTSVKFVKYDAWQYVNDSFRRMFLRTLQEQLNYKESEYMKKFYENKTRDVKVNHKITLFNVIYILTIYFF